MTSSAPASDNSPPLSPASFNSSDAQSLLSIPESSLGEQNDALDASGKKCGQYFFSADMLTFVVEDVMYRVHGYLFERHSSVWADKLSSPRACSVSFVLEDVTVADMEAFLSILYPSNLKCHDPSSVSAWSGVLRLATKWEFASIRDIAIAELELSACPLEKLVLGLALNVPNWIIPALVALCMRHEVLSLDEARQLSLEHVLLITSVREAVWRNPDALYVPSRGDVAKRIRESTGLPLSSSALPSTRSNERLPSSPPPPTAGVSLAPSKYPQVGLTPESEVKDVPTIPAQTCVPQLQSATEPAIQTPSKSSMSPEELLETIQRHLNNKSSFEEAAHLLLSTKYPHLPSS